MSTHAFLENNRMTQRRGLVPNPYSADKVKLHKTLVRELN
jgi:hypothetical protein